MKTNRATPRICRSVFQFTASPAFGGLLAFVLTAQPGQAGQKPAGVSHAGVPVAESLRLDLGTVKITSPSQPARYGFDQAKGRIRRASEGAGDAARAVLHTPNMREGTLQAAAGALGLAAAPIAAVVGGVRAGSQVLSPDELSESERDLAIVLAAMADQSQLRDRILGLAKERTRRQFVAMKTVASRPSAGAGVQTILESRIEEIRLARTGSTDRSFALLISARVRLRRPDDGSVLYDQPFAYRSDNALYLDWTLGKGEPFRRCAETGYRKLAEQIVEQVFVKTANGPIVVGTGFKKSPVRGHPPQVTFAANRGRSSPRPLPEFAARPVANLGTIYVYPTSAVSRVTVQLPMTKQEAAAEAVRDVEWSLDGLADYSNPFVFLMAAVAASPVSLHKQTVGAVGGLTEKRLRDAEAQVTAAARRTRPDEHLAFEVAQRLTPRSSQPVVLATKSWPSGELRAVTELEWSKRGALDRLTKDQPVANFLDRGRVDTTLEIELLSADLKGKDGVNPPLALSVEARATLLRASDGQEIYSCPVQYRSVGRRFAEWAANDARLLGDELDRCYHELSEAILDQFAARRLIAPDEPPKTLFAGNSN
jgi:hypothetical protein